MLGNAGEAWGEDNAAPFTRPGVSMRRGFDWAVRLALCCVGFAVWGLSEFANAALPLPFADSGSTPVAPWRVVDLPRQSKPFTRFLVVDLNGHRALHDFTKLFGAETPELPALVGIAVGADADNTRGHSLTHAAELVLEP